MKKMNQRRGKVECVANVNGHHIVHPTGGGSRIAVPPGIIDRDKYLMKHENRGHALIINIQKFAANLRVDERIGSNEDAPAIYQRLWELGFDCDLLTDPTADEIIQKLTEYASDENYNNDADCFACCIMTHGEDQDKLYATDRIMQLQEFLTPLLASNCKSLIQKPKLFFIQACRGRTPSYGVEGIDLNIPDAVPVKEEYDAPPTYSFRVPDESDFLFYFSSFQGKAAHRNTNTGTNFIQTLSEEISKLKGDVDIYDLFTRVNRSFLQKRPTNGMYQIPCFLSSLTKRLEIGPKD